MPSKKKQRPKESLPMPGFSHHSEPSKGYQVGCNYKGKKTKSTCSKPSYRAPGCWASTQNRKQRCACASGITSGRMWCVRRGKDPKQNLTWLASSRGPQMRVDTQIQRTKSTEKTLIISLGCPKYYAGCSSGPTTNFEMEQVLWNIPILQMRNLSPKS